MSLDLPANIVLLAEQSLDRLGERKTLIFNGKEYTNAQLLDQGRRLQSAFIDIGLAKGDTAIMFMMNSPKVYPVFDGIFRTGAAAIPVMFTATAEQLRYVLQDSKAQGVITDQANLAKVLVAINGLSTVRWVVIDGESQTNLDGVAVHYLDNLLGSAPSVIIPPIDAEDMAMMLYTSGTTGVPKGVMLSHRNLMANVDSAYESFEYHLWEGPRILHTSLPMAHIFGVGAMASAYTLPENIEYFSVQCRWFDALEALQIIEHYGVSILAVVPAMLNALLNHPECDRYAKKTLIDIVIGGAPLPPELARRVHSEWGCRVREGYGMTENAGVATRSLRSEPFRPGSCGSACKGCEIAIIGDSGEFLPAFARGEVITRGPSVMLGYHNNPEATAQAIQGGWLYTGDIGYLDDDGYLYIVDRKKDLIIKSGENIYPAELEAILYQHPMVVEAAIVGKPDAKHGETVVAFVVLKPGSQVDETAIVEFMAEKMEKFKLPSQVLFRQELPKAGTGKILRRELRAEL